MQIIVVLDVTTVPQEDLLDELEQLWLVEEAIEVVSC